MVGPVGAVAVTNWALAATIAVWKLVKELATGAAEDPEIFDITVAVA